MIQREHFTYSFRAVAEREATVFKSIVGLLESRTKALWDYLDEGVSDLLISTDQQAANDGRLCVLLCEMATPITSVNALCLSLPLRAGEVLACLEKAHERLSQQAQVGGVRRSVRLRTWPSRDILGRSPHYIRLATALGSRALDEEQLAQITQVPVEVAHQFIELLRANDLVQVSESVSAAKVPVDGKPQGLSLFARIRAHLGMASSRSEA